MSPLFQHGLKSDFDTHNNNNNDKWEQNRHWKENSEKKIFCYNESKINTCPVSIS